MTEPAEQFEVEQTTFAMIPGWVIDAADPMALKVYAHLAHRYVNQRRECWPSQRTLADELKVAVRTVEDAVRSLREIGAVQATRTRRDDGRLGRNRYWLPMDHPHRAEGGAQSADLDVQDVSAGPIQPQQDVDSPSTPECGSGNQTQEGNQRKEGEAIASRDEPADGVQLALVPAALEHSSPQGKDVKDPDELTARAMRVYLENWDREQFGAPANADVTESWVRSIAHRFDCDAVALLAAVEMAAVRGKVSPAPAYQPAPLEGSRLTKAAQAVVRAVYDAQHGEVNFAALMQRAKTAIKAGRAPGDVHDAMIKLIEDAKPVTAQLLAQYAEQVRLDRQANESQRGVVQS
jgi:hypothetical protein